MVVIMTKKPNVLWASTILGWVRYFGLGRLNEDLNESCLCFSLTCWSVNKWSTLWSSFVISFSPVLLSNHTTCSYTTCHVISWRCSLGCVIEGVIFAKSLWTKKLYGASIYKHQLQQSFFIKTRIREARAILISCHKLYVDGAAIYNSVCGVCCRLGNELVRNKKVFFALFCLPRN